MSKKTMTKKVKALSPKTSEEAISVYLEMSVQAILNKLYPFSGSEEYYEEDGLPRKYEPWQSGSAYISSARKEQRGRQRISKTAFTAVTKAQIFLSPCSTR